MFYTTKLRECFNAFLHGRGLTFADYCPVTGHLVRTGFFVFVGNSQAVPDAFPRSG